MLGDIQERWLMDALGTTTARWNLLAQQTLMAPFALIDPAHVEAGAVLHPADRWDGFPAARDRIFRRWAEARTPNPVVLSGDIHAFTAADIHHPDRPDGPPVAAEFVGGAITSLNRHVNWREEARLNPGIRFAENEVRGYARVDLKHDGAEVRFRGLHDSLDAHSTVSTIARFEVEAGKGGIASA